MFQYTYMLLFIVKYLQDQSTLRMDLIPKPNAKSFKLIGFDKK